MTEYAATKPSAWRKHLPAAVVWSAAAGYALLAAYLSIRKHNAFLSGYDLANFDQELWLLAHGREPLDTQTGHLLWGEHFGLTIALLTPLYVAGGGVRALLSLQAMTMAAVSPLLYALARAYGVRRWLAALPALLWLASPVTLLANLFDVHHIPLVAPVIVGSILALKRDRLILFAFLGLLACFAKEDVPLTYAMLGVVVALEGRRRLGAAISVASLTIFVFAVAVFMPAFGQSASWFAKRFAGERGDSVGDAFVWMLSHPVQAAGDVLTRQNVSACLVLVLMTGGLCLLAKRWMLLGFPALAHNVLSAYAPQHNLRTHYFVPVALAFSIAGAVGASRVPVLSPRLKVIVGAAVVTVFASFFIGAALAESDSEVARVVAPSGVTARRQAVELVPRDAIVAASGHLSAHMSERPEIYALPVPFVGWTEFGVDWSGDEIARRAERVQWIVMDTNDPPIEFPNMATRVVPLLPRLGFHRTFHRGTVSVYIRAGGLTDADP